jgi:hypothetical protein
MDHLIVTNINRLVLLKRVIARFNNALKTSLIKTIIKQSA